MLLLSLTLPPSVSLYLPLSLSHSKKKAQEAAEGGEMVLALKARFT